MKTNQESDRRHPGRRKLISAAAALAIAGVGSQLNFIENAKADEPKPMLAYSVAVTLYLAYIGFAGHSAGVLLWPAVALHAVLSGLLGWAWLAGDHRSGEVGAE